MLRQGPPLRFPKRRPIGNHYEKDHHDSSWSAGWWIFILFMIGLFVTLIVIWATRPYPAYAYYRDSSPHGSRDGRGRLNCTVGETFDERLDICAPDVSTPLPISRELMDPSVKPCDSFFRHMSGKWLDSHVNENRGFTYVYRKNQKQIHDIIRDPLSGPIYNFYRSCVDTLVNGQHRKLDQSQVNHVMDHIAGALKTHADLPVVFARLAKYGFASPFTLAIEPHPTELRMVPLVQYDTMSMPPADNRDARAVLEKLAVIHTDPDFSGTYVQYVQSARYLQDMTTMGALLDASPPDFWKLYLRELNGYRMEEDIDMASQPVWILDKQYIRALMHETLHTIPIEQWRAYVKYSVSHHVKQFFPDLPADSYFRVHNPVRHAGRYLHHRLKRNEGDEVTDAQCLTITHKLLPGLVGNVFLDRSMPNHDRVRRQVTEIVERVRDSFANQIDQTQWLTQETRDQAVSKIRSIIVRSVVPTYYEAEPFAERLTRDNYLRNLNIIRQYFATRNFELWTKGEPNRDIIQRFGAPLTEVNAFYSPASNTITIFAGILHKPFYDEKYAEVALYATIGMIAGHELAHGLDNTGRLFNRDGSLSRAEPWTAEEHGAFEQRCQCIIDEYVAPLGCKNAHYGEQTLGEDLADINGILSAYYAYFTNGTGSITEKRQFFEIFAQMWAEHYQQEVLCQRVEDDEHAIALFRVDKTLRQLKEFREAFECQVGDNMVNPHACRIYN